MLAIPRDGNTLAAKAQGFRYIGGARGNSKDPEGRTPLIEAFHKVLVDIRRQQASITEFAENHIIASSYPILGRFHLSSAP
jgi:hypothetical protein